MARQQANYQPQAELTQVTANPNIQAVQARFDPRGNTAFQLTEALGIAAPVAQEAWKQYGSNEEQRAIRDANGLTVSELSGRIKDGSMLQSQSPVYVATVKHIYGENSLKRLQDETLSGLQTGKLKFASAEELDQHLTSKRNEILEGEDRFTIAGFDKKWQPFKAEILNANNQVLNEQFTMRGTEEANQSLNNVAKTVTSAGFTGTPEEAASKLVAQYKLLTDTSLLRDDKRRQALQGVATSLASEGNKAVYEAFVNAPLDNGVTVGGVLGNHVLTALGHEAEKRQNKEQHKEWNIVHEPFFNMATDGRLVGKARTDFLNVAAKYRGVASIEQVQSILDRNDQVLEQRAREAERLRLLEESRLSVQRAQDIVAMQVRNGNFFNGAGGDIKIFDKHGNEQVADKQEYALKYLQENAKNYTFPQLVTMYSTNGLTNPDWQKIIGTGADNIASVGWKYDGKNLGMINPQGRAAIDMYLQLHAIDPASADRHAGKNASVLSQVALLTSKGLNYGIDEAVAMVNQAEHSGIDELDAKKKMTGLKSAGAEVVDANSHWYSKYPIALGRLVTTEELGTRLFGNAKINTMPIDAEAQSLTKLLVRTGRYQNAQDAYNVVLKQLSDPKVTTVANNTIYMNKDLPEMPSSIDRKEYLERFIKEVPAKAAGAKFFNEGAVRLQPNPYGGYDAMVGDVPLLDDKGMLTTYTKQDIQKWAKDTYEADSLKRRQEQEYPRFKGRMDAELGDYLKGNKYGIERYTDNAFRSKFELHNDLFSEEAFKRLKAEGLDTKPLKELIPLMQERRKAKK